MNRNLKTWSFEEKLFLILYIIIVITPFIGQGLSWVVREPAYFLFLSIFLLKTFSHKLTFGSISIFLLFIYSSLAFIFSMLTENIPTILATSRFVYLYPILFLVGLNWRDNLRDKNVLFFPFIIGLFSSLVGVIEFFYPQILTIFSVNNKLNISNYRTGLGYGLTSIFLSRVVFGFVLVYTMVISRIFVKNRLYLLLLEIYLFILVNLTLSRTAIIAYVILVLLDIVTEITKKVKIKEVIVVQIIIISFISIFFVSDFVSYSWEKFIISIEHIDPSLSGRTGAWKEILVNELSLAPNFMAFGSLSYFDMKLGVADNSFIMLLVNYGWPFVILFCLLILDFIKGWKRFPTYIKYSIIMLVLYSVTVDIFHILQVMGPLWISLGINFHPYKYPQNVSDS